jgi:IS6 family transposase
MQNYVRVGGKWTYLYRAVDSQGKIDFFLSSTRDAPAAKHFLQKALRSPGHPRLRVINVDGNPSYTKVIAELRDIFHLMQTSPGRVCPYRLW